MRQQRYLAAADIGDGGGAHLLERRLQPGLQMIGQLHPRHAADHDEIVPQPQQGAQQRPGIGADRDPGGALVLGLGTHRAEPGHRRADVVLQAMQRLGVEAAHQALQQRIERHRDLLQHPGGSGDRDVVRARRHHRERHRKPGEGANGNFQHALDRRVQRAVVRHRRQQQHDDRGDRRDVEAGIDGGDDRERRHRQRQHRKQGGFRRVRKHHRDQAAIDRAADGADQIIRGRLDRAPDAHLGHDHRGQHRP